MESKHGLCRWISVKLFSTGLIIISTYCVCSVSKQTEDVTPVRLPHKQENLHSLDNGSVSVQNTRENYSTTKATTDDGIVANCPSRVECHKLGGECLNCNFNRSCIYYSQVNVTCSPKDTVNCLGPQTFEVPTICRFCYQTEKWEHSCTKNSTCRVVSAPRARYIANCTVKSEIICMGSRTFSKNLLCNWTAGYRWSTTLILSITLGGFGADRFYLGHWQEGIGKLFSFGGLGVWTLVDVILVAVGYLGPIDGSLYIW